MNERINHEKISHETTGLSITGIVGAAVLGILCVYGVWEGWRNGFARTLAMYAAMEDYTRKDETLAAQINIINDSLDYDSNSPDGYVLRARLLIDKGALPEAERELVRAVTLRPLDYFAWSMLGTTREQQGNLTGAQSAFEQAVSLAPYYALPKWQLGNSLLRAGQVERAFTYLRQAATSDPGLLSYTFNLAWRSTDNDTAATTALIQPVDAATRLGLAAFFAGKGRTAEALTLLDATAGEGTDAQRIAIITALLAARQFAAARKAWESLSEVKASPDGGESFRGQAIINRGFEAPIKRQETMFGWRIAGDSATLRSAITTRQPDEGARSLQIAYNGVVPPSVLSQLVIVEPSSKYKLSFAARTDEIVSGGTPLIAVLDAAAPQRVLVESSAFPPKSEAWQQYSIEFSTGVEMQGIIISLQRQACSSQPCPIFGRLWLDDFVLQKL